MTDTRTNTTGASSSTFSHRIRQRYHIDHELGAGGFSQVFQARNRQTQQIVAIKIINRKYREHVGLIEREAKLLTQLRHPNIVHLIDIDAQDGDRIYMVMEFIEGGNLTNYLKTELHRLSVIEKIKILMQVAEGLHFVHKKGIVHHDIKPDNILRRSNGQLVIADFGVAKRQSAAMYAPAAQPSAGTSTTSSSRPGLSSVIRGAGTIYYIAPEVLQDPNVVDYRSDLYSLGVMAYELFAGQKPFVGTTAQVKEGHLQQQPPELVKASQDPELSRDMAAAVEKMLSKDPADRFLSAIDFARELQRALKTRRASQVNLMSVIQSSRDQIFKLAPGDYCGLFELSRPLHLVGSGESTRLYVPDGAVLKIESPNVILENLTVQRTRPDAQEPIIQASPDILYTLNHVYLQGGPVTSGAQWSDAIWQAPINGLDLGNIPSNFTLVKENIPLETAEECTLEVSVKPTSVQLEVFPRHVLPGPHKLKITVQTTGVLPGTLIKGTIHLQTEGGPAELSIPIQASVTSSIETEQPVVDPAPDVQDSAGELAVSAMPWVVQFRANGAEALLRVLASEQYKSLLNQYKNAHSDAGIKRQLRDAASSYLRKQLRDPASLWYVRRLRKVSGQGTDQRERWSLTLAIDNKMFASPLSLVVDKLDRTLVLEGEIDPLGEGVLYIERALLLDAEQGCETAGGIPAVIRWLAHKPAEYQGIPLEFVERIQAEPVKEAAPMAEDQRNGWQDLLGFFKNKAQKKQCWIRYVTHDYRDGVPTINFTLDKDQAFDFEQNPLNYDELAEQWKNARGDQLKYAPALLPISQINRNIIGEIVSLRVDQGKLEIRLSSDFQDKLNNGRIKLNESGFLQYDATGDLTQIRRQEDAFSDLEEGRAYNSHLGDFFFNADQARSMGKRQKLQPTELLMGTSNEGQIKAVEGALATTELLLIQGPPGTGKTTVIAEICHQVARQGGRTLIASQTNLAVDNALARIRHQSPQVRALRQGNVQGVEEEGKEYLQQQVVANWLQQIAAACQKDLTERQQQIQNYEVLFQEEGRFQSFLKALDTHARRLQMLHLRQEETENLLEQLANEQHQLTSRLSDKLEPVMTVLPTLLQGELAACSTLTVSLLQQVFLQLFPQMVERKRFTEEITVAQQRMLTKQPGNTHILLSLIGLRQRVKDLDPAYTVTHRHLTDLRKNLQELEALPPRLQEKRQELRKAEEQVSGRKQDMDKMEEIVRQNEKLVSLLSTALVDARSYEAQLSSEFKAYLQSEILRHRQGETAFLPFKHGPGFPESVYNMMQEESFGEVRAIWQDLLQRMRADIVSSAQAQLELAQISATYQEVHRWQEDMLQQMPALKNKLALYPQTTYPCNRTNVQSFLEKIRINQQDILKMVKGPFSMVQRMSPGYEARMLGLFGDIRNCWTTLRTFLHRAPEEFEQYLAIVPGSYTAIFLQKVQIWGNKHSGDLKQSIVTAHERLQHLSARRAHWRQSAEKAERECQQLDHALHRCGQTLQELCRQAAGPGFLPAEARQAARELAMAPTRDVLDPAAYATLLARWQQWQDSQEELSSSIQHAWTALQEAARLSQRTCAAVQEQLAQNQLATQEQQRLARETRLSITRVEESAQQERTWWHDFWQRIPASLRPFDAGTDIFAEEFRAVCTAQFQAWHQQLDEHKATSSRFDSLLSGWIEDIQTITPHERKWLEDIYVQNANVIGITCGQVNKLGKRDRSANGRGNNDGVTINGYFDAVIIDEVSKATAPELLLPAMRGRKLILIGDHRQLPPMIEEKTLDEMAEAEGKDPQSYAFLRQSYFKDRFTEAPPELKCQLTIQYRMHPDIMAAINQFYDIPLECGLTNPDVERDHKLAQSNLVRRDRHLLWVATPQVQYTQRRQSERNLVLYNRNTNNEALRVQTQHPHFGEQKMGWSYYNERELEIIEGICEDLQRSWHPQFTAGAERKEIGIITFYAEQNKRLQQRFSPDNRRRDKRRPLSALKIRVGTVDRFQGMERPVIIVSMVRNNTYGEIGFAKTDERINVAFSRAQELLVIVGCHKLFCEHGEAAERYSRVAEAVKKQGDFIDVSAH